VVDHLEALVARRALRTRVDDGAGEMAGAGWCSHDRT
jgi:hypothetical protein